MHACVRVPFSFFLSLLPLHSRSGFLSVSLFLQYTHTRAHAVTRSLSSSHSQTHTRTKSLSPSFLHTHTHFSLFLSLSLSLSLTHTHWYTHTHSHSHTLSLIHSLIHLFIVVACAVHTFPEMSWAFFVLSKYMIQPGPTHLVIDKKLLLYHKGRKNVTLWWCAQDCTGAHLSGTIYGYADASFADTIPHRHSSVGYVFLLSGTAIFWRASTTRNTLIVLNATEAELYSLSSATQRPYRACISPGMWASPSTCRVLTSVGTYSGSGQWCTFGRTAGRTTHPEWMYSQGF